VSSKVTVTKRHLRADKYVFAIGTRQMLFQFDIGETKWWIPSTSVRDGVWLDAYGAQLCGRIV
jgi:hypothetical protein